VLVSIIPFIVYSVTLSGGFVYDDHSQVLKNPWITDPGFIPEIFTSSSRAYLADRPANTYRPLVYTVFMVEYFLFGLKPWGWHLVNLLLHSANTALVFLTVSRLTGAGTKGLNAGGAGGTGGYAGLTAPFFAALVFALHTINSEVVAWVSGVPELTYTLFTLLAFYLYTGLPDDGVRGKIYLYIISLASFFLALLCKETAIVFLVILPVYELVKRGPGALRLWKRYVPYVLTAAVYMTVRTYALEGIYQVKGAGLTPLESLLNVFPLVARYLGKLLFPGGLSVIYTFPPVRSLAEPMAAVGITTTLVFAAVIIFSRRSKTLLFTLLWILIPLMPVLYTPTLSVGGFADRYLYLPSVGFASALGCSLAMLYARPSFSRAGVIPAVLKALAAGLLILYSVGSFERSLVWRDDLTLWTDTVRKSPGSANARYNLAWRLHNMGEREKAAAEYLEAIRLAPDKGEAHFNLAVLFQESGQAELALAHYGEAIRVGYSPALSYFNMGNLYHSTGNIPAAAESYTRAIELNPGYEDAYYNLARTYQGSGDFDRAIPLYREVIGLNPKSADAHYNLGVIYKEQGLFPRAIAEFTSALEADPGLNAARVELDRLISEKGEADRGGR